MDPKISSTSTSSWEKKSPQHPRCNLRVVWQQLRDQPHQTQSHTLSFCLPWCFEYWKINLWTIYINHGRSTTRGGHFESLNQGKSVGKQIRPNSVWCSAKTNSTALWPTGAFLTCFVHWEATFESNCLGAWGVPCELLWLSSELQNVTDISV